MFVPGLVPSELLSVVTAEKATARPKRVEHRSHEVVHVGERVADRRARRQRRELDSNVGVPAQGKERRQIRMGAADVNLGKPEVVHNQFEPGKALKDRSDDFDVAGKKHGHRHLVPLTGRPKRIEHPVMRPRRPFRCVEMGADPEHPRLVAPAGHLSLNVDRSGVDQPHHRKAVGKVRCHLKGVAIVGAHDARWHDDCAVDPGGIHHWQELFGTEGRGETRLPVGPPWPVRTFRLPKVNLRIKDHVASRPGATVRSEHGAMIGRLAQRRPQEVRVSREELLRPRTGKVIAVRDVETAAKNGRAIVVTPDTVVTPAARERAAELNVSIRVQRARGRSLALPLATAGESDDLIEPLAAFVLAAGAQPLPEAVLDAAKLLLIDALAVGYAGLRSQPVRAIVDALAARRHGERGHVIGLRQKLAPSDAALANAALIHALELDAWFERGAVAPVAGPVATALALADEIRLRDPKALLPAIAVGLEVACRIAAAATGSPSLSRTAAIAALGGAATAALLLELDVESLIAAFGLALTHALYPRDDLADLHVLAPGFGAHAAVQAARLAAGGVRGMRRVIEGASGYAHLVEAGQFDRGRALEDLGAAWLLEEITLRLYPVDPAEAIAVEAAVRLGAGRSPAERLAQIVVEASPRVLHHHPRRSDHVVAAGTGAPRLVYLVAQALRYGWVGLAAADPTTPIEPEVWDLMERIELAEAADVAADALVPLRIVALTTDGLLREATVATLPGTLADPTTHERLFAKLTDCWRWSGQPRYRRPLRLVDAVSALDRAQSLSAFWSAVSPQAVL